MVFPPISPHEKLRSFVHTAEQADALPGKLDEELGFWRRRWKVKHPDVFPGWATARLVPVEEPDDSARETRET